jgi:hypothetical protein
MADIGIVMPPICDSRRLVVHGSPHLDRGHAEIVHRRHAGAGDEPPVTARARDMLSSPSTDPTQDMKRRCAGPDRRQRRAHNALAE